jgi:hypothetical protein
MIIDVSVNEYRHAVTAHEIGLTRDSHTVSILRQQYAPQWFTNPQQSMWAADLKASPGFQWYVDKYAEATTLDPWDDVSEFFRRMAKVSPMPSSGVASSSALYYPGRYPLLNTSAMASAAEALAGWFCEIQYKWNLIARPPRVTPDLVFRDNNSKRWTLIEVKSSSRLGNVESKLTTDMIKLLEVLAKTKLLRPNPYNAGIVMVQVEGPTRVQLTSLVLEEV